jgi:hypothetical protein
MPRPVTGDDGLMSQVHPRHGGVWRRMPAVGGSVIHFGIPQPGMKSGPRLDRSGTRRNLW